MLTRKNFKTDGEWESYQMGYADGHNDGDRVGYEAGYARMEENARDQQEIDAQERIEREALLCDFHDTLTQKIKDLELCPCSPTDRLYGHKCKIADILTYIRDNTEINPSDL